MLSGVRVPIERAVSDCRDPLRSIPSCGTGVRDTRLVTVVEAVEVVTVVA